LQAFQKKPVSCRTKGIFNIGDIGGIYKAYIHAELFQVNEQVVSAPYITSSAITWSPLLTSVNTAALIAAIPEAWASAASRPQGPPSSLQALP